MMQDTFHSSIKIWSRQTYKYYLIKRDHIIITWIGDLWIFEYEKLYFENYICQVARFPSISIAYDRNIYLYFVLYQISIKYFLLAINFSSRSIQMVWSCTLLKLFMCCLLGTFFEKKNYPKTRKQPQEPLPLFSQVIGFPFRSNQSLYTEFS